MLTILLHHAWASSHDLTTEADFRGLGTQSSSYYGKSVAAGVDYTGDGVDDLIVAAPQEPWGASPYPGVTAFYSGGYSTSETAASADATLVGNSDWSGEGLAHGGDIDGDGWPDLVVGAPDNDTGGYDAGAVYIIYGPITGSATLDAVGTRTIGAATSDGIGDSVWSGGDLTGDGTPDILAAGVSANSWKGAVWQLDGAAPPSTVASATGVLHGQGSSTYLDNVSAGDLDADGQLDAVVGGFGSSWSGAAAVWVFSGGLSGSMSTTDADTVRYAGRFSDDYSVPEARFDVDQDGYDDLLVGAPYQKTPAGDRSGALFVFYGPLSGTAELRTADAVVNGPGPDSYMGYRMTGGGDTNGNGVSELMVSAIWADGWDGRAYLFEGALHGAYAAAWANEDFYRSGMVYASDYTWMGSSLAFVPDLNGDGNDEVLIGGMYASDPVSGAQGYGMAWMAYGPF